jgi:hypothetical protein
VHWTVGLILGLAVAAALVVPALLWVTRTRTLSLRVGSFACGLATREGGKPRRGIAQYGRVRMYWWRRASLAPRAATMWRREGLVVLDRRALPEDRAPGQRATAVVVHCKVMTEEGPAELWLTMGPAAYSGFMGWIEATPTPVRMVF